MKKLLQYLQKAEDGILIGTFVVMVLASFAQVLNRNLFHLGISWFEELARYCMVYMALIAAEAGLRAGTQISITALTDKEAEDFESAAKLRDQLKALPQQ